MRSVLAAVCAVGGLACFTSATAQVLPYPSYQGDGDRALRLALRAGAASGVQLSLQPLKYNDLHAIVRTIDTIGLAATERDEWQLDRVRARLDERLQPEPADRDAGWLKRTFYQNPAYALSLQRPGFSLYVNPVLDIRVGQQSDDDFGGLVVQNTRGISLRGSVDERVWFSTNIYENQAALPSWETTWRAAYNNRVPGVGFYKDFDPLLWDEDEAVDYLQATGELGFTLTKHISLLLGHGNPRLGIGYRSLLLDNFVDPYLYAQIDTRVWRLHYRNLYAQLQDGVQTTTRVQRKFLVAHTLGVQLTDSWEVGVTEQTIFSRTTGFDAQYLNPVIFYRAVEQDNGSPDNAMIGAHSTLRLGRQAVVYGQYLLDEFKLDELLGGDGWWGNKYALQLGGKWFDVAGATGLDATLEYNQVRPFTYGHRFQSIAFTHYDQPLAHPWGAAFQELYAQLSFEASAQWRASAAFTRLRQNDVSHTVRPHLGANVLIPNGARERDYGYEITDETEESKSLLRLQLAYRPFPGARVLLEYTNYIWDTRQRDPLSQHGVTFGISLNAVQRSTVF